MSDAGNIGLRHAARYEALDDAAKSLRDWVARPEIKTEGYEVPESLRPILAKVIAAYVHLPLAGDDKPAIECHGLDTPDRVRFYEHDFYPLSNFSAFSMQWKGERFDTSEHVYHWEKFPGDAVLRAMIRNAPSAHEAFKLAEKNKHRISTPNWPDARIEIMGQILRAKVAQHEYVKRKLLATGDRLLVEDSWRDDFWGWGPDRSGKNMLGAIWMEIRAELRTAMEPT